jgi:hypothetical protein
LDSIEFIGSVAALLTTFAFLPQVVKTWRTRSADDFDFGLPTPQNHDSMPCRRRVNSRCRRRPETRDPFGRGWSRHSAIALPAKRRTRALAKAGRGRRAPGRSRLAAQVTPGAAFADISALRINLVFGFSNTGCRSTTSVPRLRIVIWTGSIVDIVHLAQEVDCPIKHWAYGRWLSSSDFTVCCGLISSKSSRQVVSGF